MTAATQGCPVRRARTGSLLTQPRQPGVGFEFAQSGGHRRPRRPRPHDGQPPAPVQHRPLTVDVRGRSSASREQRTEPGTGVRPTVLCSLSGPGQPPSLRDQSQHYEHGRPNESVVAPHLGQKRLPGAGGPRPEHGCGRTVCRRLMDHRPAGGPAGGTLHASQLDGGSRSGAGVRAASPPNPSARFPAAD